LRQPNEPPAPLVAVRSLAQATATGEISWTTPQARATVYLERGRVAWATSTLGRFSFARELASRAGIDPSVLRVIVERCREQGTPFGEALDVRASPPWRRCGSC